MRQIEDVIIRNEEDTFVFFEVLKQINPTRILDIGMLLKRIGAVARGVRGEEVSSAIVLDGIDFVPEYKFPLYEHIYNEIIEFESIVDENQRITLERFYDIVFLFRTEYIMTENQESLVWEWLKNHTKYVVTDCTDLKRLEFVKKKGKFIDLKSGEEVYGLIAF